MMWRLLVLVAVVRCGSAQVFYPGLGGGDSCPWWFCQNNGVCVPGEYGADDTCDCPDGYSGTNCETRDCRTVFITTSDQSEPLSANPVVVGLYARQEDQYNWREVYKKDDEDLWLFYMWDDYTWLVGGTVGSYPAQMSAENAQYYPDQTAGPFYLHSPDGWMREPYLEIRCSGELPCHPSPCQNGGTCVQHDNYWDSEPFYTCTCVEGFNGTDCENNHVDECASNPCFNGATCVDGLNSYTCECIFGSVGTHCERVLPYFREQFLKYEVAPTSAPIECYVCDSTSDGHCDVDQSTLSEEFRNNTNTTQACSGGACWVTRSEVNGQLLSYQRSCEYNNLECDDIYALENCQDDPAGTKVCYRCCTANQCNFGLLTGNAVFVLPSDSGGAADTGLRWLLLLTAALALIVN